MVRMHTVMRPLLTVCIVSLAWAASDRAVGMNVSKVGAYSADEATTMAVLSAIAYCIDMISTWSCKYCTQRVAYAYKPYLQLTNASTDTHGYIAVNEDKQRIVVSFRGTEDLRNWITDLNGFTKADMALPFCDGADSVKVHSGFFTAYQSIREQVLDAMTRLNAERPHYDVYVIGHSLGAALATLCALDLTCGARPYSVPPVVYNYGSPRIGDIDFATLVAQNVPIFRSTHWQDIVPHVPPQTFLGFYHVATEYFLQEVWDGYTVKECDGSGEDESCADQFSDWSCSVSDHLSYYNVTVSSAAC